MSHTGASPCGLLDELHFTMLFKCKFSIVFIWMDCKCFCHLGSLWFLQTCCFYPQFPFPLTGAVSHDSDSFTPDTVCVGVSSSFPSLQAHFSVVPQKIFDHFCVGGFIFEVCLQYLLSETYVLDSGAELSFVPQVQSGEVRLWTGCLAMFLRPLKKCISSLRWKRQVPNYQCCSSFVKKLQFCLHLHTLMLPKPLWFFCGT